MAKRARLRIHGNGEIDVDAVIVYLSDLRHAYNSIILFDATIDGFSRTAREFGFPRYPIGIYIDWPVPRRRGIGHIRDWPPRAEEIASFVPSSEQLALNAVQLSSPGFWEFVGTLNPLEVLRKAINDRHERRKDREYRETAEKQRLELENQILETELVSKRVALAKELGATERDLAPLLNELVYRPISQLGRAQDRGIITYAERAPDKLV